MPSFKGDELPLARSVLASFRPFGYSRLVRELRQEKTDIPAIVLRGSCLPVESSDEVVARWGFIRSRRRTLLYARARVSAGGRRLCWQSICIKLPLLVYFTQG